MLMGWLEDSLNSRNVFEGDIRLMTEWLASVLWGDTYQVASALNEGDSLLRMLNREGALLLERQNHVATRAKKVWESCLEEQLLGELHAGLVLLLEVQRHHGIVQANVGAGFFVKGSIGHLEGDVGAVGHGAEWWC